jgi:SAM-dependent methyltransferase
MAIGLIVARQIARNLRAGKGAAGADVASGSELDPAAAARYAARVYRSLVDRAGLTAENLAGARVLEVGPGDNLAFALRLIAAGARSAVAVDRFAVLSPSPRQWEVYAELLEVLEGVERQRAQSALCGGASPPVDPDRIRLTAVPVERAADVLDRGSFDLAVSIAALQHTLDIDAALRSLDRLLAPGGTMIHQLDLGDMGLFTGHGLHPLTFLTVGDRRYRWMGSNLGLPNRVLLDRYRALLGELGYRVEVHVTKLIGDAGPLEHARSELVVGREVDARHVALVEKIRPRLLRRYRELPALDLIVGAALIVAHKPADRN